MRRGLVLLVLLVCLGANPLTAIECHGLYHIGGSVVDAAGRPLAGASVRVLFDRFDEKKFRKHGPRSVVARTDETGWFARTVDCGTSDPGPCANRQKYLTVFVEAPGERTVLRVFKLEALDIEAHAQGCRVRLPVIGLRPDR